MVALAAIAILTACKKDKDNEKEGIFKGPVVQVHGGKALTWVQLDNKGNPLRLAVTINDAARTSVPMGAHDDGHDHSNTDNNWVLKFHPKAAATVLIMLEWVGTLPATNQCQFMANHISTSIFICPLRRKLMLYQRMR